jgi:hypothetical protein
MRSLKFMLIIMFILTAISCAMYSKYSNSVGYVRPNSAARNEIIMTDDLNRLLQENPKPKLVIRVPNPPSNVTEAEQFNYFVNIVEKVFIGNGYTVRDRGLLENLLRSGSADFETIGEKIDTDIIIDILTLRFDIPNKIHEFFNLTTSQEEQFLYEENYVDCPLAALECRVTIVEKGQLGGAFTFYTSRCDLEHLEFIINSSNSRMTWTSKGNIPYFPFLSVPIEDEKVKELIIRHFTDTLINQLSAVMR